MKSKKLLIGFAVAALVGALALVGCGSNASDTKEAVEELELGGSLGNVPTSMVDKDAKYTAAHITSAQEEDDMIQNLKTDAENAPDIEVYRWAKVDSDEGITDLAKYAAYEAGTYDAGEAVQSKFYDVKAPCYAYTYVEKSGSKSTTVVSYIIEDGEDFIGIYLTYKSVVDVTL